ncbi:hypothetical protein [Streptomyces sp. NBC_01716]|uniref:hypothetical protein n=1 Tax=Streptomyces sp. NBC_01716 TaxID=2975917 RepID=UPI002E36BAE5|nr:hypothetical protein [Streptomyces sp. NBC_01716]
MRTTIADADTATLVQETTDALRAAFRQHGLAVPGLSAVGGTVELGEVTVATADRLACLLGAPVQRVERNLEEWPEVRQVMRRLGAAFTAATGGGFLDLYFHHDCVRCDRDAALALSRINAQAAQRLLVALRPRAA